MKFKNITLTTDDFNDKISGVSKQYKCWCKDVNIAKKHLTGGENLICLASVRFLNNNTICRDYIYIGFHKTLDNFFLVDFKNYENIKDFFFIPVSGLTETDINEIIFDIKSLHLDNEINL